MGGLGQRLDAGLDDLVTARRLRVRGDDPAHCHDSLLAEFVTEWNMMMAFSILASAPLVVAFIFLQRYFVRGMTVGAIK